MFQLISQMRLNFQNFIYCLLKSIAEKANYANLKNKIQIKTLLLCQSGLKIQGFIPIALRFSCLLVQSSLQKTELPRKRESLRKTRKLKYDRYICQSGLKIQGFICQSYLKIQGFICQSGLKIQGFICQSCLKIQGFICQSGLKIQGFICQSGLKIQGFICQSGLKFPVCLFRLLPEDRTPANRGILFKPEFLRRICIAGKTPKISNKISMLFVFAFFNLATAKSLTVNTANKDLLAHIEKFFKSKPLSNSDLQKFLADNDYYSSELIQKKGQTVIKNPYKIIFIFKGNKFFKEWELKKLIQIDENKIGSFFYNFVKKTIYLAYQEKGFLDVKIEKTEKTENWKKWIILNISEGSRIRIAALKVKGLLSQAPMYYEKFIMENSSKLIKSGIYNKKDLEKGYNNLIDYLKSKGYLQSKIYSDRVFFKKGFAFITVNLEEGPLTFIRDIQIRNANAIPVWEILSHIKSRIQSGFQIDAVQQDLKHIEELYKSKGYMLVKITNENDIIKLTEDGKYVDITIDINEGPKAYISKISFIGLNKVKPELVKSLLQFKEGDILTPLKKEKSLQSLSATGLFSNISLNEHIKDNTFEIIAVFKERRERNVRGALGFNSQRGLTTQAWTELTHRNLFGWGRALVIKGNSQINFIQINKNQDKFIKKNNSQNNLFFEYEFSGRYKEVFIPKYNYQGNINLSHSKNLFSIEQNINFVKKTQLSFFIDKKIKENLKLKWNVLSFESRKEFCVVSQCPQNPQKIASTNVQFVWDKRNNIFNPSEGYLSSLTTEWASPSLGGDKKIAFIKTDLHNYFYWSFFTNYIIGLILKGGLISTVQNSSYIPVSRAFILGGYTSLRGYDGLIKGERLPRKKYTPISTANEALKLKIKLKKGDSLSHVINSQYALMKINLHFPIFDNFKALLFYDLGAVYLKSNTRTLWDYGHSAGLGFRYQTFLIPIGLDIAYQLPPKECILKNKKCSYSRFHLSIGW